MSSSSSYSLSLAVSCSLMEDSIARAFSFKNSSIHVLKRCKANKCGSSSLCFVCKAGADLKSVSRNLSR